MVFNVSSVAGVVAAPRHIADQRPTADAAAIARDPAPKVPLGVPAFAPPTASQVAAVSRSLVAGASGVNGTASASLPPVTEPERVLKPFGIFMLPAEPVAARPEAEAETAAETSRESGAEPAAMDDDALGSANGGPAGDRPEPAAA